MSEAEGAAVDERSLAKGIIAGLIGGLAGTLAKTFAERMFPPHTHDEPERPEVLAGQVAGDSLAPAEESVAAEGIQWSFGAAAGAVYGALAEYYPAATAKEGVSFGLALETLTHETAPALGFSAGTEGQTVRERASEMTSDVVYGITTEMVRKFVRKWL